MGNNAKKNNSEAKAGSYSLRKPRLVTQIKPSNQLGDALNRRCKYQTSPGQTKFATLKLTHAGINNSRQNLPLLFLANNRITEPGLITILGKDGSKTMIHLIRESSTGRMKLGKGWREFVLANGLKSGESFTLEAVWEDDTLMLKLSTMELKKDKSKIEKKGTSSSEINHRVMTHDVLRASTLNGRRSNQISPSQTEFVTLELTHASIKSSQQNLPLSFLRNNRITEPGSITILGKDGSKTMVHLLRESSTGRMKLGKGWRQFVVANGLKIGESFTLEAVWEDDTLMLKLSTMELKKEKSKIEKKGTSSSEINHRIMTLKLTHEILSASTLILSVPFMKANRIEELGKIGFVGQDNTVCWGYLLSRTGIVAFGIGWEKFCESNGLKEGDLFNLKFIPDDQNTFPVLKLCPYVRD